LTATAQSSSSIALSWTDNSNNESGFKVYRGGSLVTTTAANATSYTDTGLSASTAYSYYIVATNGVGDSPASNTASTTTQAAVTPAGGVILTTPTSQQQQPTAEQPKVTTPSAKQPVIQKVLTVKEVVKKIADEAKILIKGKIADVLSLIKAKRNLALEKKVEKDQLAKIIGKSKPTTAVKESLKNFITYGTPQTVKLGLSERAGVLQNFQSAFNRLPKTEKDWLAVLQISTGQAPSIKSKIAETNAEKLFKKVFGRAAVSSESADKTAIAMLAYGVRPKRDLKKEVSALQTFRKTFKKAPSTAEDWNAVRAIAYAGVKKMVVQKKVTMKTK
jgi:hypothetical protein